MKILVREDGYYVGEAEPYVVDEHGLCDEYGPYATMKEAREIIRGVEKLMPVLGQYTVETAFGAGAAKKGVYTATFNGLQFHVKENEVWFDGKRAAVFKGPPTTKNLLKLSSHLLSEGAMATTTTKKRTAKKTSAKKGAKGTRKTTTAKKKTTAKGASKKATRNGKSSKQQIFELLNKNGEMTGRQVAEAIGSKYIPNVLGQDDRIVGNKYPSESGKGNGVTMYSLSKAGKEAIKKGTV